MFNLRSFTLLLFATQVLHTSIAVSQTDPPASTDQPALESSVQFERMKSLYEQQIVELESEYGPMDYRILEPLTGLSDLLIQQGDPEQIERVLNRRQQLLRVEEGPTTVNQIPIIADQIRNDFQRGLWDSVTERFESIYFIYSQNSEIESDVLLNSLNDIHAWHLLAMYLDSPDMRNEHIDQARAVQERIYEVAIQQYGANSEQLIPWLYSIASEPYRIINYLQSERLRTLTADNYIGRDITLGLINYISEVANSSDNAEAQAMAMIYRADFELLHRAANPSTTGGQVFASRRGNADQTYRQAMEMLADAGIEQSKIDEFFARPMPLPVSQFHFSLEAALEQRKLDGFRSETAVGDSNDINGFHVGDFAFTVTLPKAQIDLTPELTNQIIAEQSSVLLYFTVDSVGRTRSARIIESVPDEAKIKNVGRYAVEALNFRPAFIDGRWRRVREISMRVLLPYSIQ